MLFLSRIDKCRPSLNEAGNALGERCIVDNVEGAATPVLAAGTFLTTIVFVWIKRSLLIHVAKDGQRYLGGCGDGEFCVIVFFPHTAGIVECPMYKGCRSYGTTIEEAIENI